MSVVLATGSFDRRIRFWDAPSGVCSRIIKFPDSQLNRIEISPDKQFLAAAGHPRVCLYEILPSSSQSSTSNEPVLTLEGHTANVTALGFQKEGRYLFTGAEDGTLKLCDLRNPNYIRSFDVGAPVNSVCLRVDRDELICGDQHGRVTIFDIGTQKVLNQVRPGAVTGNSNNRAGSNGQLHHHQAITPIQSVDISEDSRTLVAASNHGTVYVWDPSGAVAAPILDDDNHPANDPTASLPEDDTTMSPMQHLLRPVTKFRAHAPGSYCLRVKIAPDCRNVVTTSSDGTARLWDTTTWENTATLRSHKWVWDAAFCADSSYLVTASSDHVTRLFNLRTAAVVRQYAHPAAVTCVALNDSSV